MNILGAEYAEYLRTSAEALRYEIKDILPPPGIVRAMELQAEAERRKRAQVLESEGVKQATINESEAQRVCWPVPRVPLKALGSSVLAPGHDRGSWRARCKVAT